MTYYSAPPNQTGMTLNNDDSLTVHAGGVATKTTINSGAYEEVSGGLSIDTTINSGGIETIFTRAGLAGTSQGTTINNGGVQDVFDGGTSKAATINNGGVENVTLRGAATDTIINAGGLENVYGAGTSKGTTINDGGVETVATRGLALDTTVNSGGVEIVDKGGLSDATRINAGGTENILNGAESFSTTINAGGVEIVQAGGMAENTTINGGIERILAGGAAVNVTFVGSQSTLELGTPSGLKGSVSDWHLGDTIDFLNTAVSSAQKMGDVLTVTYGNDQHASYVIADQAANTAFALQSDGDGGTNLILTPIAGAPAPSGIVDPALQIESLYVGYFGRAGDPAGMTYWQDQLIAGHGSPIALASIAESFSMQAEAQAAYPLLADLQHATQAQITSFISSVYENLFDRAPDAAGAAYWQQQLGANIGNPQAIGSFILSVIGGAQTEDATTLANKTEAAKFFSGQLRDEHVPFDAAASAIAQTAIDGVTSDPSTVTAAELVVSAFIDQVATATDTALSLVLNYGDILNVPGHAYDTTINDGGVANILSEGQSNYTNINSGGVENVLSGGLSHGTTVASGGVENVYGRSIETEIDTGGVENVYSGGTSVRPHIDGGVEHIFSGGKTQDVVFSGPNSTLELATPSGLTGAIVNWRVGDVIDLLNIRLTDLHQSAGDLTVTYEGGSATYAVVDQQAGTFAHAVSDGHGGTNLILTQIVNAIGAGSNQVSSAGLGDASAQLVGVAHNFDHAGIV